MGVVEILQEVSYRWWWVWPLVDCQDMVHIFRQKILGIFGFSSVCVLLFYFWVFMFLCQSLCATNVRCFSTTVQCMLMQFH